ncbi:MAG: type II secretion system protein N [Pseudomonadales bacterium]|jgi:general secretion pathway protein C|nr:type II secretion system protein N [Pseudomonadales bacterium]MDP6471693.1 type II secretion system protein N [Pseudomonadales bacterium]MDP6972207.1 type II secretion system protein N [Pseudomonadales bacterium]|tara:strand:- start:2029 stop:2901 length:873 start_codon:yes stop_codon:yes gene_type:complete
MAFAIPGLAARAAEPVRWLVIAGIAYTLATTVLSFLSDSTTDSVESTRGASTSENDITVNLNQILSADLFGRAQARVAEVERKPTQETRLPLELKGVFQANHPDEGAAIIAQKGKSGLLYSVGDQVPGNATLHAVHTQHVVLRRGGVLETLTFPETRATFSQDPGNNSNSPLVVRQNAQPTAYSHKTPLQFVETYRKRLRDDPDGTLAELGIRRVSDDGATGYRLDNLAENPYLRQTGLQTGDVILSVNGRPVGDVGQDRQQLDTLLVRGSARLEVQRGSRRFFVTASLK